MAQPERRIVIAIDASEQAEMAFNWYLTTIHRPENNLVLVHVPEIQDSERNRMVYVTAGAWEDALSKEKAKIKELEETYNTKILENGISGRVRTEGGNKPGEIICRIAEEEKGTMIVMGTRGLGKVRRTIMGSVSDYVVHHAHCPVIVCRQ